MLPILQNRKRRFVLIDQIGLGGFSRVYRAYDRLRGCHVAIKVMDRNVKVDVCRELDILSSLMGVDGMLQVIDYFKSKRHHYIVTALYSGGELYTRIVDVGRFAEIDARLATKRILEIVSSLHKRNILHRDLKPENLIYKTRNGSPTDFVLADFGLAGHVGPEKDDVIPGFAGSRGYVAPELYAHSHASRASDMWSVGLIIYGMLVGGTPWRSTDALDLAHETLSGEIRYPTGDWHRISPAALDFVQSLLRFEPSERLTAEEALAHHWISPSRSTSLSSIASTVSSLGRSLRSRASTRSSRTSLSSVPPSEYEAAASRIAELIQAMTEEGDDCRDICYPVRPPDITR